MAAVNLVRAAVLALLAGTIVTGHVSIVAVLVALFVLGTAETFADIGGQSILPRIVRREDLGIANARIRAACCSRTSSSRRRSGRSCSRWAWRSRSPRTRRASRWGP